MSNGPSTSFSSSSVDTVTMADGRVAHREHIAHSDRLVRRFYELRPGVWCLVGNGLSNQTFVEGPEGIIAIDTGESVAEMADALVELRKVTSTPIVAVMYTHFHYVSGTQAILDEDPSRSIPVWGHSRIAENRVRTSSEIGPAYSRGLVEQFALQLPPDGPDGVVNVGLGLFFRSPAHAPFTPGYVEADRTFDHACVIGVAGLEVHVTPAPSDADDSVTFWFPSVGLAVHNLVWPVLFNVFAIRGEEYRDPRILLTGLDHLLSLEAEHLAGAHGPPINGAKEIQDRVTKYRDSLQFLWDQTVRAINRGLTGPELAASIRLPALYERDYLTTQFYGVVEHHVRQIRTGLFGFFDGFEGDLFPLPTGERCRRLIDGFGGRIVVRDQARHALASDDVRWALELGSWLVRATDESESNLAADEDRQLLADALRTVAQRTTSANIRSWCLTRSRTLEGTIDFSRFYRHRFNRKQILSSPPERTVHLLRVMLDPDRASGIDVHLAWEFPGVERTGLHVRNCVACPTDGRGAMASIVCDLSTWADVLTGALTISAAIDAGTIVVRGDVVAARRALASFDVDGLRA